MSNLVIDAFVPAIDIEASGVTLDLNGFSIVGMGFAPGNVSYPCVTAGTETQIVMRNGIIQNCPFGIQFPNVSDATIEQVHIQTSGNTSVAVAANAIVRGSHLNGANSSISCPSIVVDTTFVGSAGNNGIPTSTCAKANLIGNF